MDRRKLGILLSTPPGHPSVTTVTRLAQEALVVGTDVYLYLIDEGVKNLNNPHLLAAAGDGAKYFVCAYGCQQHGVKTDQLDSRVTLCGLVILANIVDGCDRFVAFN